MVDKTMTDDELLELSRQMAKAKQRKEQEELEAQQEAQNKAIERYQAQKAIDVPKAHKNAEIARNTAEKNMVQLQNDFVLLLSTFSSDLEHLKNKYASEIENYEQKVTNANNVLAQYGEQSIPIRRMPLINTLAHEQYKKSNYQKLYGIMVDNYYI